MYFPLHLLLRLHISPFSFSFSSPFLLFSRVSLFSYSLLHSLFLWTRNEGPWTGSRQRHHSTAVGRNCQNIYTIMTTAPRQTVACCLARKNYTTVTKTRPRQRRRETQVGWICQTDCSATDAKFVPRQGRKELQVCSLSGRKIKLQLCMSFSPLVT